MTCFWDGILIKVSGKQFRLVGAKKPKTTNDLIKFFKKYNKKTTHVKWNNEWPSEKQLKENKKSVEIYRSKSKKNGYLCSGFDPFLFLLAELFQKNVEHYYMGNRIFYTYVKEGNQNIEGVEDEDESVRNFSLKKKGKKKRKSKKKQKLERWVFKSSSSHFWSSK